MTQSTLCIGPPARAPTCCRVLQSDTDALVLGTETGTIAIGTEPLYDPNTHTSVWFDDFEGYTAGNAPTSGYVVNQSHGTVSIDNTVSHGGTQSCKFTVSAGGCLSAGTDANIGLEKGLSGLANYSTSQRTWYVSWYCKYDVGYYDLNCGGEFKEMYIFRLPAGDATGSASLIATRNGGPLVCPDFYGSNVVPAGTIGWSMVPHSETGCAKPASCAGLKQLLRQELVRTTERPIDLDDGLWHRCTLKYVRESVVDAGDGAVLLWVDGIEAMHYNGQDVADVAYHQVYTRTTEFRTLQIFGIINQGLSASASRWLDDFRVYRDI